MAIDIHGSGFYTSANGVVPPEVSEKIVESMKDSVIDGKIVAPHYNEHPNVIAIVYVYSWTGIRKLKKNMDLSWNKVRYSVDPISKGSYAIRPNTTHFVDHMYEVLLTDERQVTILSLLLKDKNTK